MWRVVAITSDDGAFGYTAPPVYEVVADFLTKAEAKAIERHYLREQIREARKGNTLYIDSVSYVVEVLYDGEYINKTMDWAYEAEGHIEEWCERKGISYMDYIMQ